MHKAFREHLTIPADSFWQMLSIHCTFSKEVLPSDKESCVQWSQDKLLSLKWFILEYSPHNPVVACMCTSTSPDHLNRHYSALHVTQAPHVHPACAEERQPSSLVIGLVLSKQNNITSDQRLQHRQCLSRDRKDCEESQGELLTLRRKLGCSY